MTIQIDITVLVGFFYALIRTGAWIAVSPPFNANVVPSRVKIAISVGLSLLLAPAFASTNVSLEPGPFILGAVYQAFVGAAMGFLVLLLFQAVQVAGQMVDLSSAFSSATLYDPFSNASSTPIGRLFEMMAITILFVIDGHLMLVRGLITSFTLAPVEGFSLEALPEVLIVNFGVLFVGALQIAFPLLAALFLAEVTLGLMTRAAPQLNILIIGFNVKILMLLSLLVVALPIIPRAVERLVEQILSAQSGLFGG